MPLLFLLRALLPRYRGVIRELFRRSFRNYPGIIGDMSGIYSKFIRHYFCIILALFWHYLGAVSALFWRNFRVISELFRYCFSIISALLQRYIGVFAGLIGSYSGIYWESLRSYNGVIPQFAGGEKYREKPPARGQNRAKTKKTRAPVRP